MWYISLAFAISILLILFIYQKIIKKEKPTVFLNSLKRAPWTLIPFLLSMFIIVLALSENGITARISELLNRFDPIYGYGISSFLFANVMNNIPMTIFYADLIHFAPAETMTGSVYAAIIGSNLGAYLTPIGALAGIMWMRILKREDIPLSFLKFVKYGILISIPTILIALFILSF
jgi:arsenical pump membrane protein